MSLFAALGYITGGVLLGDHTLGALIGAMAWFMIGLIKTFWVMGVLFWNFEWPKKPMSRADMELCVVAILFFSFMNIITGPVPLFSTPL